MIMMLTMNPTNINCVVCGRQSQSDSPIADVSSQIRLCHGCLSSCRVFLEKERRKTRLKSFFFTILLVVIVPLGIVGIGYSILIAAKAEFDNSDPLNLIGAVVSAMAFGAVWVSIRQQSEELSMQREELTLQRDELHATVEESRRIADAQQATEIQLSLATYVSALDGLHGLIGNREHINTSDHYELTTAATLRGIQFKLMKILAGSGKKVAQHFESFLVSKDEERALDVLLDAENEMFKMTKREEQDDSSKVPTLLKSVKKRIDSVSGSFRSSRFAELDSSIQKTLGECSSSNPNPQRVAELFSDCHIVVGNMLCDHINQT